MFIWKPGKNIAGPPSAEAHQKLVALIEAGTKAGTFLGTDGLINGPHGARVQRTKDGKFKVTDGPYTETKEHMGGFWILECANIDEALAWAKKAANICDVAGEVRELLFFPAPEQGPGGNK
jgi:hypothetical protein